MTGQETNRTLAVRAARVAVALVVLAVCAVAGFAVGRAVPPSSALDPVRAELRLAEDDNGKLYLGDVSVSDAYGVDRVVRAAPDAFFDALPLDCAAAFTQMASVAAAYESLTAAPGEAKAVWGQAVLVAQNVCTFDGYVERYGADLAAWVAAGAPASAVPAPVDPDPVVPPPPRTDPADSAPTSSSTSTTTAEPVPDTSVPVTSTPPSSTAPAPPDTTLPG